MTKMSDFLKKDSGVALLKSGMIILRLGRDKNIQLPREDARELAEMMLRCCDEEPSDPPIPMVSFSGMDVDIYDLIGEETIA